MNKLSARLAKPFSDFGDFLFRDIENPAKALQCFSV